MATSLEQRVAALETATEGDALCTEPRCKHMALLRLNRQIHGLPEYPLPPHPAIERHQTNWLRDALMSLHRQPGEDADAYAERIRPKPREPYFDPYFKVSARRIDDRSTEEAHHAQQKP